MYQFIINNNENSSDEDNNIKNEDQNKDGYIYSDDYESVSDDPYKINLYINDSVVASVLQQFAEREQFGYKKYGTNLDRKDLSFSQWIQHAQEEMMDATLYLEKIKEFAYEFEKKKNEDVVKCECSFIKFFENPAVRILIATFYLGYLINLICSTLYSKISV